MTGGPVPIEIDSRGFHGKPARILRVADAAITASAAGLPFFPMGKLAVTVRAAKIQ